MRTSDPAYIFDTYLVFRLSCCALFFSVHPAHQQEMLRKLKEFDESFVPW